MSPKVGMGPVRREQIVRATVRCLAREGYTRLTMKKVAREAGVSQGILHYYFADKRAMLAATLEVVTARPRPARGRGPVAHRPRSGRPPARARAGLSATWRCAARSSGWCSSSSGARCCTTVACATSTPRVYTRTRRLLARLIAEGVRAGRFRAVDPARAAAVVLGLVDGLSLQLTFDPEAFTRRRGHALLR